MGKWKTRRVFQALRQQGVFSTALPFQLGRELVGRAVAQTAVGPLRVDSSRHSSTFRRASARLRKLFAFRHSSRERPLKLSFWPFCIRGPGWMWISWTPRSSLQARKWRLVNSGPWHMRKGAWGPGRGAVPALAAHPPRPPAVPSPSRPSANARRLPTSWPCLAHSPPTIPPVRCSSRAPRPAVPLC